MNEGYMPLYRKADGSLTLAHWRNRDMLYVGSLLVKRDGWELIDKQGRKPRTVDSGPDQLTSVAKVLSLLSGLRLPAQQEEAAQ